MPACVRCSCRRWGRVGVRVRDRGRGRVCLHAQGALVGDTVVAEVLEHPEEGLPRNLVK